MRGGSKAGEQRDAVGVRRGCARASRAQEGRALTMRLGSAEGSRARG